LLDHPHAELEQLCTFIEVDFELDMLRHWEVAQSVVGWMGTRSWGRDSLEPLRDTRLRKFVQVFSAGEREYLEGHLLWGGEVRDVLEGAEETASPTTIGRLKST